MINTAFRLDIHMHSKAEFGYKKNLNVSIFDAKASTALTKKATFHDKNHPLAVRRRMLSEEKATLHGHPELAFEDT